MFGLISSIIAGIYMLSVQVLVLACVLFITHLFYRRYYDR